MGAITPSHLEWHRQQLAAMVRDGSDGPYPFPLTYRSPSTRSGEAARAALALSSLDGRSWVHEVVARHVTDRQMLWQAAISHDPVRWDAANRMSYGSITDDDLQQAQAVLAEDVGEAAQHDAPITAPQLAGAIRDCLAAFGLDWEVVLRPDLAARASVSARVRRIQIRSDLQFDAAATRRLIAHEVGGHVLRWENAWSQTEQLLAVPLGHTIGTEEGLAMLAEEYGGGTDARQQRIYAARLVAVHLAQGAGIVEVATKLAEWLEPTVAAEIAFRVKRGLADPNSPGAFAKDQCYFTGRRELAKLAERDLQLLFSSKWSQEKLPLLRQLDSEDPILPPRFELGVNARRCDGPMLV